MFLNPKLAIEKGWITGVENNEFIQPNAIDFTLDKLFEINNTEFIISEKQKEMRSQIELLPKLDTKLNEKAWRLEQLKTYDGMSNIYIDLPEGVAALLITRSTFNRNGLFIISGLYDSGFRGNLGFVIYNNGGVSRIACGTRIGQVILVESDSAGIYAGQYNTDQGKHWSQQ